MTLSGLQEHLGLFDRSRFDPPLFGACDDHDGVKDLRLFSHSAVSHCAPLVESASHCKCPLLQSLLGVKRTCRFALHMSAFDPKRTSASFSMSYAANLHLASLKVVNFEQTRMPDGLRLTNSGCFSFPQRRAPKDSSRPPLVGVCLV